ncbi:hypothetical protein [Bartonella sp. AU55XJBT]|nr:hypothetical protein [Bartonella sp. AU55XJBT]
METDDALRACAGGALVDGAIKVSWGGEALGVGAWHDVELLGAFVGER